MLTDTACRNLKPQAKPLKKSDGSLSIGHVERIEALVYGLSFWRQAEEAIIRRLSTTSPKRSPL
jgi:hypothetical protein